MKKKWEKNYANYTNTVLFVVCEKGRPLFYVWHGLHISICASYIWYVGPNLKIEVERFFLLLMRPPPVHAFAIPFNYLHIVQRMERYILCLSAYVFCLFVFFG